MSISQADGDALIHELEALLDEGVMGEGARREHAAPTPESLAALQPRYQVRALVGAGGMGQVFDAFDTQLQRRVAIKVVSRGGPLMADLMRRERKILAALDHPGIVGVYDGGELSDGQPYFVMQFVEGEDLRSFARCAALSQQDKVRLMAEIARAVGVAHLVKVVHRDLKPSNIRVTAGGRPMVLDFGLAKYTAAVELEAGIEETPGGFQTVASGRIKGTLAYMSPEQAAGERVDSRSDVYALGVNLHELLTGALPHEPDRDGSTPLEWSRKLRSVDAGQRRAAARHLPAALRAILEKCLAPAAAIRYPTAIELADDLDAYLAWQPVSAVRRQRGWHLAAMFARRNRCLIVLLAALSVLLLATVTLAFIQVGRQRNLAEANARSAQRERQRAIEREQATRRYLYAADVGLAQRLWQNRQTDRAQELLDRYRPVGDEPDLRTFEWHYVQRLCARRARVLTGHTAGTTVVRFSLDGQRVASADAGGEIRVWDATHGGLQRVFSANRSEIRGLGFLPGGEKLYSIGKDRTLRVWSLEHGRQTRSQWWPLRPLAAAAGAPDGSQIAIGDIGGWVYLWEPNSGRTLGQILAHRDRGLRSLAYSADGGLLASGGKDQTARVWDVATRTLIGTYAPHLGPIDAVAFSPDGRRLACGSTDRILRVWEVGDPSLKPRQWQAPDEIVSVGFDDAGATVWAACKNGTVMLLGTDDRRREMLHAETSRLQAADTTSSLDQIVSTAGEPTVQLARAADLKEFAALPIDESLVPARLELDDSGRWLAVSYFHQPRVDVWDLQSRRPAARLTDFAGHVTSLAFSSHDGQLLTTDMAGQALRWQAETGRFVRPISRGKVFRTAVVTTPDGRLVLIANAAGEIEVYDAEDRPLPVVLAGHDKMPIVDLQVSADGRWLASCGWDKSIHVWELATGGLRHVLRGHHGIVHAVRFHPDCRQLASCGADGTVRLWDCEDGLEQVTLWRQPHEIFGLCYSRDGRTLAAACGDRGEEGSSHLRMWNVATQQETLSLEIACSQLAGLAFAPRDARLWAGAGPGREGAAILQFEAQATRPLPNKARGDE